MFWSAELFVFRWLFCTVRQKTQIIEEQMKMMRNDHCHNLVYFKSNVFLTQLFIIMFKLNVFNILLQTDWRWP